jgi:peptidoglycan/xylan/chitin deacetylase (PgdA/CDA1 family)
MMRKSFKTLMFHGVADSLNEHCVFTPSKNCFVRTADFEKAIEYCSKRFKILRPDELGAYFNGTASDDGIFITVDDGLQYFFDNAVPILKKYNAPATVFITSDWTNEGIEPAIFSLEYHLYYQLPAKLEIKRKDFSFEKQVNNKNEISAALTDLWNQLFAKKISANAIRANEIILNGTAMSDLPSEGNPAYWQPASWETIKKVHVEGTIQIGAHGKTHTPFSWLSADELERECIENKEQIAAHLNISVSTCTFPHGMYDETTLSVIDKMYSFGFTNRVLPMEQEMKNCISRYNVPFQRPNSVPSLLSYPFAGKIFRKAGSVSGLF